MDKLWMHPPQHAWRCKREKQCPHFKYTRGGHFEMFKKDKTNAEGGAGRGVCLCHYRAEAVGCPPSETLPCVSPYISATLYMTHFIHLSQAPLRSPVRRCKNNHPCFGFMLISLPSGEATWDKAQATLDTSNQWNPQGLRWVFNEVHCSQLESSSPRNGLTFRLLFVLSSCLSLSNWSTPAQSCLSDAPFVFVARVTGASHSIMKQRSIISL